MTLDAHPVRPKVAASLGMQTSVASVSFITMLYW